MTAAAFGIKPSAEPAWVALCRALVRLDDQGRRPVCLTDPDAWVSDDRGERAAAAEACVISRCPLLELCGAFAELNGERWGSWGGTDRTPTTSTRKAS